MTFFNIDFIHFFENLSKNNHKTWFDENRKIYEKEVKEPFTAFVGEMIHRIQKHDPSVQITPKDAIFRINKDVRFSKDKIPYNTHVAANISEYGRKNKAYPGFYFQLSHQKISIFGGAYMLETDALQQVRNHTSNNLKSFAEIRNNSDFKEKFGDIRGEQHKRLPDTFKKVAQQEPLIANKQFYYTTELDSANLITAEKLPDKLMEYYFAGKELNDFLKTAMTNP